MQTSQFQYLNSTLNRPKLIHLCSSNGALNVLDDDDYKDDDDCDDDDDGSDDDDDSHTLITRQKEVIVPASESP